MFKKHYILSFVCCSVLAAGLFIFGESNQTSAKDVNQALFTGIELDCGDCKSRINDTLSNLLAIKEIEFHPDADAITVVYNDRYMEDAWIANALEASGFTVEDIQ